MIFEVLFAITFIFASGITIAFLRLAARNCELQNQIDDMARGMVTLAQPMKDDVLDAGIRRTVEELAAHKGMRSPWAV